MSVDDAAKVAEVLNGIENGFFRIEAFARLRAAFPEIAWSHAACGALVACALTPAAESPLRDAA